MSNQETAEQILTQIGAKIRKVREQKAISRLALSQLSGVSQRYLAQLESGSGNISILLLYKIAAALDQTPLSLLSDDGYGPADIKLLKHFRNATPEMQNAALEILDPPIKKRSGKDRICFIGLRGAGKSTLGRMLADEFKFDFLELNDAIEQQSGIDVSEVMALYGQEGYRQLEQRALETIIKKKTPLVLAAGGGIVSEEETFSLLLQSFKTVWLKASPAEHMQRVREQGDERPMAGNPKAMQELRSILTSREQFYARADITINTGGKSVDESFAKVLSAISS